ncbi:MAG TPA: thiamine pyrophosphate-binding protein, partial [Mycobacterium sp.]|nr:thiamine pyrophosphate-binding protein [Mycobacterium sp.]
MTTGAHVVIDRLIAGGVDVCFANPGTSEMHFVAALDSAPQMRAVLCPFEGVATGAADGYARIAGRPAATLLHLGPGMANGLANLHNARRAHSPVVNVVGDHATYHQKLDAPLQSDIEALGNWLNGSVHRPASGAELGAAVDAAILSTTVSRHIATLILPADLSWSDSESDGADEPFAAPKPVDVDITSGAEVLKSHGEHTVLLLGGPATTAAGLRAAARICAATGAKALVETFPARLARGQGVPDIPRLGYFAEQAQ